MTMRMHSAVLAALLTAASKILIAGGHWLHGIGVLFGVAYGVIIQRSRVCFATAFYGNAYLMRGILLGLLIASVASYVLLKTGVVAAPHVVAFGIHVFVGSLLFGFLMPFVGGCMLRTIYRVGTSISTSAAAFLGILLGNLLGPVLVWDLTKGLAAPTTSFVLSVAVGLEAAMAVFQNSNFKIPSITRINTASITTVSAVVGLFSLYKVGSIYTRPIGTTRFMK